MITIEHHLREPIDPGLEKDVVPRVGERLAPLFGAGASGDRSGLFVASTNSGFASSLAFWSNALRTGVGLASPELFPWCLANAPCGWLARRFRITGPNSTYLGGADALLAALGDAYDNLAAGRIGVAHVVVLIFQLESEQAGQAAALRLGSRPGAARLEPAQPAGECLNSLARATEVLFSHLDSGHRTETPLILSDGGTAFAIEPGCVLRR